MGIVYRNICDKYGVEVSKSQQETPPKVVDNNRAKFQWDFKCQTDKQVLANKPDILYRIRDL